MRSFAKTVRSRSGARLLGINPHNKKFTVTTSAAASTSSLSSVQTSTASLNQIQNQKNFRSFSSSTKTKELNDLIIQRAENAKNELATLAQAFARYDGDGQGALNPEQIARALKELDLPDGETDVKKLFAQLDVNDDGTIELHEWLDNLPKGTKLAILDKAASDGSYVQFKLPEVKIMYTYTDEAPMLATYSLLPILRAFCRHGGVKMQKKDISVASRVLAAFPDFLSPDQRVDDDLQVLSDLAKTPAANIIKLPNVSASIPQLESCIAELQSQGFKVPDYPANPKDEREMEIKERYSKITGSAVNPALREGNSDRRVAPPVKAHAANNPHKVGKWEKTSKAHVAHMTDGDFYSSEKSYTVGDKPDSVRIELVTKSGDIQVLKPVTQLLPGEVIDATCLNVKKLSAFYEEQLQNTDPDTLFSLHLKATMMKVSDPIMFGHCVKTYYKSAIEKHSSTFEELKVNFNNGIGDAYSKLKNHPKEQEIISDIEACYNLPNRPQMAYVNSRKGITNLHVPSDVIVDASMAAAIRDGGKMWNKDDQLQDAKFVIPDRCYASIYQACIEDCIENGELVVSSCGHTPNVGLMAAKAEEYGSHDKTFEVPEDGQVRVILRSSGEQVFPPHDVEKGDIWRMCQTKDIPIKDWVRLAVNRARTTGSPAIFWLDVENRAHDAEMMKKVDEYLKLHDTEGLDIKVMKPYDAMKATMKNARAGKDTITVTGNVLRDYLTDLFPILELGTSAKMLSIVPLLAGGGMYETGAGGSAPKHVQQFLEEGHLRWDSLGEFLAMVEALDSLSGITDNADAKILAKTLSDAVGSLLNQNKSPKRSVMELDNRGSHFYLALFWAEELAKQQDSLVLASRFKDVAKQLRSSESQILGELLAAERKECNVGGYWRPDPFLASQAMRPSPTLNRIIDATLAATGF